MFSPFPFSELYTWYLSNGRHTLPWRDYSHSPKELGYRVWLAEIMLQQTQADRVGEYFQNIIQAFPTVEILASTSYEDFFPYYKGLGYYSRARNMLATAGKVVNDFDGIFPSETELLKTLPGVGPYTAEAIRAFAYDIATLSFDTNLEKIFSRYYFGTKTQKLTQEQKNNILRDFQNTGISARDINNALMDFGALVSLNSVGNIDWENYPLKDSMFYETGGGLEPIVQKKSSSFPTKHAHVFAILHENHKKYFSSPDGERENSDISPFYIGKNSGNPREMTKNFFLNNYGLEVSVRPPEVKSYLPGEIPYLVSYVQVQSGEHDFHGTTNIKVRGNEEGIIENSGIELDEKMSLF